VTWNTRPARFTVPSFDAETPLPAVAFVAPFGSVSAGQTFMHALAQAVLLGFNV
jgi:fermentation-respiration switch protein FrsA (DUF1100 family)